MKNLINSLRADYPQIKFVAGEVFSWAPAEKKVIYPNKDTDEERFNWSLLHETGHALLGHQSYSTDIELVSLESEAWAKAKNIAKKYSINIEEDHIQDCIDTYRDWLHQRSACPNCNNHSIQQDSRTYRCFNCGQSWSVSSSRFCRPYRLKTLSNKKSPQDKSPKATFV